MAMNNIRYKPVVSEQPVTAVRKANAETSPANHRNSVFNESVSATAIYQLLAATAQAVKDTNDRFNAGITSTMAATLGDKAPSTAPTAGR